ncbi:ABC transporter permease [Nitratireductor kimnyeongensis]|nr:ABC transporter permease [Nitratireductor kimnyeongensis]
MRMKLRNLALPGLFWLFVAYLFLPLFVMAAMGFRDSNFVAFPIHSWTTKWYSEVLLDRDVMEALWLSARVAIFSTVLSVAVGLPIAFAVARTSGIARGLLIALILLPAFLPVVVSAISLRIFIGRIGLETGTAAIAFGHAVGSVPFVVIMVLTRLNTMGRNMADAARNLGADDVIILVRIVLPYLSPALLGAFMFCLLLSFEDFVRSFFLGGFEQTFPVLLFARLRFGFDPGLAAISTLVLIATTGFGLYAERFVRKRSLRSESSLTSGAKND